MRPVGFQQSDKHNMQVKKYTHWMENKDGEKWETKRPGAHRDSNSEVIAVAVENHVQTLHVPGGS